MSALGGTLTTRAEIADHAFDQIQNDPEEGVFVVLGLQGVVRQWAPWIKGKGHDGERLAEILDHLDAWTACVLRYYAADEFTRQSEKLLDEAESA